MKRIHKIDVLSSAQTVGTMGAILGLCAGVLYGGGGAIYDAMSNALSHGTLLALLAILAMPAIGATGGFIGGTVIALLYNLASKWSGGIKIDLK